MFINYIKNVKDINFRPVVVWGGSGGAEQASLYSKTQVQTPTLVKCGS